MSSILTVLLIESASVTLVFSPEGLSKMSSILRETLTFSIDQFSVVLHVQIFFGYRFESTFKVLPLYCVDEKPFYCSSVLRCDCTGHTH